MITRRRVLYVAVGAAVARANFVKQALAQNISLNVLAEAGPLGDVWLGDKDAPVTIIEYASMPCSHCATFHTKTWPALKERYVDTGKVRFTLREFPIGPLATAAFMQARCAGKTRYYPITDLLFERQADWAFTEHPVDKLRMLMQQAGIEQQQFDNCLRNQEIYDAINVVKNKGAEVLQIDSTPTFFVNGRRLKGDMPIETLSQVVDPLISK